VPTQPGSELAYAQRFQCAESGQIANLDANDRIYNEKYGPTLTGLPDVYAGLRSELETHLQKEEMILFPVIDAYEAAAIDGSPLPRTPFGSVGNPIGMMEAEHDSAGAALAGIREITANHAIPECACVTYRSLMAGLGRIFPRRLSEILPVCIWADGSYWLAAAAGFCLQRHFFGRLTPRATRISS
jgi:hypothetical protein